MKRILLLMLLFPALIAQSQTIFTWVDTIPSCYNHQVIVPVRVKNFDGISSISLTYSYNGTALTYLGFQNLNPALTGMYVNNISTTSPPQIRAAWYSPFTTISLPDNSILFEIVFNYNTIISPLNWLHSSGYCLYTNANGDSISSVFNDGLIYQTKFDGYVKYDNTLQSPVQNVKVIIKKNTIIIDSTLTDATGHYLFTCLPTGPLSVECRKTGNWGGANALDALLLARYSVGLTTLSALRLKAADINNNGTINSGDALFIIKRFTGFINSFPIGDWVFEGPFSINLGVQPQTLTIKALCAGDLDGSYIP